MIRILGKVLKLCSLASGRFQNDKQPLVCQAHFKNSSAKTLAFSDEPATRNRLWPELLED